MTEQRLKEIEGYVGDAKFFVVMPPKCAQELIDEIRFLQAALADARKELQPEPPVVVNS